MPIAVASPISGSRRLAAMRRRTAAPGRRLPAEVVPRAVRRRPASTAATASLPSSVSPGCSVSLRHQLDIDQKNVEISLNTSRMFSGLPS